MEHQISSWGKQEAIELAKKFGIDQAAMIAARALLEQQQAAEHATINANIRAAAGIVMPGADAQPDAASGEQPSQKRADANAGNGAAGPAPDVRNTNQRMNDWIRGSRRG